MAYKVELHPEAVRDFAALDGSVKKDVARRIDAVSNNPFIGHPLGNRMGFDLSGFYKLYAARRRYRIVYHLVGDRLEIVEIVAIGRREGAEVYRLASMRAVRH